MKRLFYLEMRDYTTGVCNGELEAAYTRHYLGHFFSFILVYITVPAACLSVISLSKSLMHCGTCSFECVFINIHTRLMVCIV